MGANKSKHQNTKTHNSRLRMLLNSEELKKNFRNIFILNLKEICEEYKNGELYISQFYETQLYEYCKEDPEAIQMLREAFKNDWIHDNIDSFFESENVVKIKVD